MKIRSLYTSLINRFKTEQKIQPRPAGDGASPRPLQSDRRELTSLVTALQEAERLEEQGGSADAARLHRLEKKINRGTYRVDVKKLAEAMLRSSEGLPARQEEEP